MTEEMGLQYSDNGVTSNSHSFIKCGLREAGKVRKGICYDKLPFFVLFLSRCSFYHASSIMGHGM